MTALAFDVFYRDHGAEGGLDRLGGKLDNAHGKFSAFKTMAAGFGVAAAAGLVKFGSDSAHAFMEAEEAAEQLAAAQARFPMILDVTTEEFGRQAMALQAKTKFDDEAITMAQATLAQFEMTGKMIERLTPLVVDYAQKSGKDLVEAATDVGKAINSGQGRALKAVGIEFAGTGDKMKDFLTVQMLLEEKVGGAAEAAGTTAAGKYAILKNQFNDVEEEIGGKLLPALVVLGGWLLTMVGFIDRNRAVIGPLAAVIGTVVVAQWAWNVAMAANPIGLIIIGVAALIAVIVWAATKTTFFQTIWAATWGFLKGVGEWFAGPFAGFFTRGFDNLVASFRFAKNFVVGGFTFWVDTVRSMPGRIAAAAAGMWDGIKTTFRSAVNWVLDKWNRLEFRIPPVSIPGLGQVWGGATLSLPDIPLLARGTRFFGGGLAILGERGPELAVLPRGTGVAPGLDDLQALVAQLRELVRLLASRRAQATPAINVYGPDGVSPRELAALVARELAWGS